MKVGYIHQVTKMNELNEHEKRKLEKVGESFAFRTNTYYNSLINWSDPKDPLRKLILPDEQELVEWGDLDFSQEQLYQPLRGVEHKYENIALLLCIKTCAAYCRFCFRKRLFMEGNDEVTKEVDAGIEYIRNRPEINNVLLTGGDPLLLPTVSLKNILDKLCAIEHVKIIRIGTKIPAFNPYRMLDDPSLTELLASVNIKKQVYIMAHYNHPNELTEVSLDSLRMLKKAGVQILNQTPLLKGINDDAYVLADLIHGLSNVGVPTYYIFACRHTLGNIDWVLPLEEGFQIINEMKNLGTGFMKMPRFVMSDKIGKVEFVGLTDHHTVLRFHNMVNKYSNGELLLCRRNANALWMDDYPEVRNVASYVPEEVN